MGRAKRVLQNPRYLWFFGLLSAALWGSATACVKLGFSLFGIDSNDIPSQIVLAGVRFSIAGVLGFTFYSLTGKQAMLPRGKTQWKHVCIVALTQILLDYGLYYAGVAKAAGTAAGIINGMGTFFTILIAVYLYRTESMTRIKTLACLFGFAGLVVMNLPAFTGKLSFGFLGEGILLVSQVVAGWCHNITKGYSRTDSPALLCTWQFILGGPMLLIAGLLCGGSFPVLRGAALADLLYLSFTSVAAFSLWDYLMQAHPVSKVSLYNLANPLFCLLFCALLLGEKEAVFRWTTLLALLLTALGIYLANGGRLKEKRPQ